MPAFTFQPLRHQVARFTSLSSRPYFASRVLARQASLSSHQHSKGRESKSTYRSRAVFVAASAAATAIMSTMAASQAANPTNNDNKSPVEALRTQVAGRPSESNPLPPTSATITRLMLPDSANPAGNVHGGSILAMVDEAGWAAATKFVNQSGASPAAVASLARIEKVDFIKPMFIGEMAEVQATVTFTSDRSIEVKVDVYAENILKGTKRLTNQARAWYVAKEFSSSQDGGSSFSRLIGKFKPQHPAQGMPNSKDVEANPVLAVPAVDYASQESLAAGMDRYEQQKQQRIDRETADAEHPIEQGDATLIHVLHPSDCHANSVAQAGAVLKLMDTAAGVVCVRHCRSNVVTASLEAVDFLQPIHNGELLEIHARPVFNSKRSMDIEVNVYAQSFHNQEKMLVATSIFTFVSLNERYQPQEVPPILVETEAQKARFQQGVKRYEQRKALRAKEAAQSKESKDR
eukprot:TRINITY_DN5165_c0_g1_i1.p1 TRINITY_DN5165_c0_g1~~TRINITY_DN5165_c0_g1_i1.p1  ORF type:complete len:462 (+),score=133.30 TRINITY_DN5165_c0_g1_i1:108-1493(+)